MSKDEIMKFLVNTEKRLQTISKLNREVLEQLDEGKIININDEQFKNKYNEYRTTENLSQIYK